MRPINEIIVHCTATRPDWMAGQRTEYKVDAVRRWHVAGNGWADIGYHYLIDRDGTVAIGRPLDKIGAHVKGHNTGTVGVSLFGGYEAAATDSFEDHFTDAQDAALRRLIADLRVRFPAIKTVSGHNEYAAKGCPGFRVGAWLAAGTPPVPDAPLAHADPQSSSGGLWAALVAWLLKMLGK